MKVDLFGNLLINRMTKLTETKVLYLLIFVHFQVVLLIFGAILFMFIFKDHDMRESRMSVGESGKAVGLSWTQLKGFQ